MVDKPLAVSASAGYQGTSLDATQFSISVSPKPGVEFAQIEQVIDSVISDVGQTPVRSEDLERVKPFGVLMEGVTPTLGRDGLVLVTLRGKANQRSELLKFEQNLMGDASFRGFELQNEQKEQGSPFIVFNITVNYIPGGKP